MRRIVLALCALLVLTACSEKLTPLAIRNVLFLNDCTLAPGGAFPIAGKGFREGDVFLLESGGEDLLCETAIGKGKAVLTLPEGISSGQWRIVVDRAGVSQDIGAVNLTIDPDARPLKRPAIIAHRGYHKGCPENSIAALRKAQDIGADGSETDVWMSADGEIFIYHDESVAEHVIRETHSSVLSRISLSNGEKLPTLKAYLAQAAKSSSCRLVIEIKDHKDNDLNARCVEKVLTLVGEAGMQDRVDYISFNGNVCRALAAAKGTEGATVGYLTYDAADNEALFKEGVMNVDFFFNIVREFPEHLDAIWTAGLTVNVWTLCDKKEIMEAIRLKVDLITTDIPSEALDICNRLF